MSRYIGKRVSYPCGNCGKQFTLNKKSVDDSEQSGEVFCAKQCFKSYKHDENEFWCKKMKEEIETGKRHFGKSNLFKLFD